MLASCTPAIYGEGKEVMGRRERDEKKLEDRNRGGTESGESDSGPSLDEDDAAGSGGCKQQHKSVAE